MERRVQTYAVDPVFDDPIALQNRLQEIAKEGGRVISVTWQPEREALVYDQRVHIPSGYTVVSEHEVPNTDRT